MKRFVRTVMLVSPQSLGTGNLALQHVTHSHPHGFMADALVVVLTVPWVALLRKRPTHRFKYFLFNHMQARKHERFSHNLFELLDYRFTD